MHCAWAIYHFLLYLAQQKGSQEKTEIIIFSEWSIGHSEKIKNFVFWFDAFQPQVQGNKGMIGPRGIGCVALRLTKGEKEKLRSDF